MQHHDTRTADARDTTKATAYLTDSPLAGLGSYLHRNLVLRLEYPPPCHNGAGFSVYGTRTRLRPRAHA